MLDEELVLFHDGELPEREAERVREVLDADPERGTELEAIRQIDRMLVELDRLRGPTPEEVERGKAALRARLERQTKAKKRRWLAAIAAVSTSVAAGVAIVWLVDARSSIGTVRYSSHRRAQQDVQKEKLRPGSLVRTSGGMSAALKLPGVAEMNLTGDGLLRIGDQATDFELAQGVLKAKSYSELTITIARSPYALVIERGSFLSIFLSPRGLRIDQQRGRSSLLGGSREEVLEGRRKLVVNLQTRGSPSGRG